MVGVVLFFTALFMIGALAIVAGTKQSNIIIGAAFFTIVFRYVTLEFSDFKYVLTMAALAGLVGLFIVRSAKNTALFCFGFIVGVLLAQMLLPFFPAHYPFYFRWALVLGTALLGGFFVKDVSSIFLALAVSFFGGYLVVSGLFMLLDQGMALVNYASTDTVGTMYNLAFFLKDAIVPAYNNYVLAGSLGMCLIGFILQKPKPKAK